MACDTLATVIHTISSRSAYDRQHWGSRFVDVTVSRAVRTRISARPYEAQCAQNRFGPRRFRSRIARPPIRTTTVLPALEALRDEAAHARLAQSSIEGKLHVHDQIEAGMAHTLPASSDYNLDGTLFEDATHLWEAQRLVFIDAGLVALQPESILTIVKPLADHWYNGGESADVAYFNEASCSYDNDSYNQPSSRYIPKFGRYRGLLASPAASFFRERALKVKGVLESLRLSFL